MNLPINYFKRNIILNSFTKQTKPCRQLLKKFYKTLDGLSGMKKFMMKINGTFTGRILGKIYFLRFIFFHRPSLGEFKRSKAYQKLLHIPKTGTLCTKDSLARLMKKMKQLYGQIYNFTPLTFILPNEYKQFINYFNKEGNEKKIFICKPSDLSRGRGISIINNMEDLKYD